MSCRWTFEIHFCRENQCFLISNIGVMIGINVFRARYGEQDQLQQPVTLSMHTYSSDVSIELKKTLSWNPKFHTITHSSVFINIHPAPRTSNSLRLMPGKVKVKKKGGRCHTNSQCNIYSKQKSSIKHKNSCLNTVASQAKRPHATICQNPG